MKKEKLINDVLNLYSALNNVFFENHYLRRRITRREKEFLLKRSITSETPIELVKNNVERYVNIFYADFISNENAFDKYTDKQKQHLFKLNGLIKQSKADTIEFITNEFARIFALDNDYIQSATLLEKSLAKILDESENEITSLSGQINSCMLLWDYEKEGYYTYKLTANDDACEECAKLNGKELSIKEFSENEFFPLVHPNCKCKVQILNENGEETALLDENSPQEEKVSLLDQISNFLAVASFIPGFDTFTNFASIPVDLLRGDFLSAGLDVIGVIPVIGEAADIAKTINKADDIADIAKFANKVDDASDVGKIVDKSKICTRDILLSKVNNLKLKNAINEIYRTNATIGDGGLADAIRYELQTGKLIGGKSHIQKGKERLKNLENIIKKQNLNSEEQKIAIEIMENIKNALEGN